MEKKENKLARNASDKFKGYPNHKQAGVLEKIFLLKFSALFFLTFLNPDLISRNTSTEIKTEKKFAPAVDIQKIQGCTSTRYYGATAVNPCNGEVCITMTVTAEGMHGVENWHFDWGNGKTWDTSTTYSATPPPSVNCPGGSTANCGNTICAGGTTSTGTTCINGVCNTTCKCVCPVKIIFTKCGIYSAPGTYTISMSVTPAHSTCLDNWVITIPPPGTISVNNATICPGQPATLSASGAIGYSWLPGGMTGSTITVSPSVTTTYTVIPTGGCANSGQQAVVTVNPSPVITAAPQTISCGQTSTTLTAAGGTNFTWSTGATTKSITVSPGSTTTYTVRGINAQGCTNSTTVVVTVTGCGPNVIAPPATLCAGGCASLTATGSGGTAPYTYTWFPSGTVANPFNACPPSTTTYTVVVSDASGQTASTTAVVTINPNPTITSTPSTVCAGTCTSLTAGGAGPGGTYNWTPNIGSGAGPHNVCPPATTTYSVTGTTSAGCTGTTDVVVTVNPNPVLSATPATICIGDNATITANGATTYTWSTGAQTQSITVSPGSTITYTVFGTTNGCTGSVDAVVTINTSITVPVPPATICAGLSATLTAGGSAVSYTWSTGAQTQSITVSPTVTSTYTVAGTSSSGCTGTGSVVVTVNPIPVISATSATICLGNCASLTASGAGPGGTYTWNPTTGLNTGNGAVVNACPQASTTYTVSGTTATGCSSSVLTNIFVNPIPVVTVNSGIMCAGGSVTLNASGASTYLWSNGATTPSITMSPQTTTSYTVVGFTNNCSNSAVATITVDPTPVITANSPTVCTGTPVTITASGAQNYTWMPGNTTGSTLSYTPTANTTYTITGSSTGAGCPNTTIAVVTVNPIPIVYFEPDTAACAPLTVTFLNLSQANLGGSSCNWTFTGGVPASSNACIPGPVTYSNPGVYSVTLTVTSNGCSATLVRPNIISVYPYPKADFTASPQPTSIWESRITFKDLSSGSPVRWFWTFKDGECQNDSLSDSLQNPVHTYCDTGRFEACLTIWNQYNCPNKICKEIIIGPEWTFYIPNAFTPNKDGKNEFFIGKSWNVTEHEMWIYDRWGNMIYYTGQSKDPESAIPWDGRANGGVEMAQEDVYVWVVHLKDVFGKRHKYIGHVTLVK